MIVDTAFIISITICLMAIPLVIASHEIKKDDFRPYISFLVLCVCTALYQWFSLQYFHQQTIDGGFVYLKLQACVIIVTVPLLFYCFAKWTEFRFTQIALKWQIVLAVAFFIYNLQSDYSFRYAGFSSSEQGATLERSVLSHFYYAYAFVLLTWIATRINYFYNQGLKPHAYSLSFFVLALFCTALIGMQIDNGAVKSIYMSDFPLTLLILLFTINIAYQVKVSKRAIELQKEKKERIELAMTCFAKAISNESSTNFYKESTLTIQQLYQTKYAFIGLYNDENKQIDTIATACDGELISNFSYALKDTPCADVVGHEICSFDNHVDDLFPKDVLLKEMGIKSYVGLPLFDNNQAPLGIVVLLHDKPYQIDDDIYSLLNVFGSRIGAEFSRDQLSKKLKKMAYHDYTSGLPNRARLFDEINSVFKSCIKREENAILMLMDIDKFKDVNRIYGYDTAENILKVIGRRLKKFRSEDVFISRNEGDEFAIIFTHIDGNPIKKIEQYWQEISTTVQETIVLNQQEIKIELSAGVVIFPEQVRDLYSVNRCAETALQQAKYAGRNQFAIYDPNLQKLFDRKQALIESIKGALARNDELFLVYQPQTAIDGRLLGGEALIRWKSPDKGFISPAEFIPLIEETELIHSLGLWVFKNVLMQIKDWQQQGKNLPEHISVNIAAKQLLGENFTQTLIKLCDEYQIAPGFLLLELTESGLLVDIDLAIDVLKQLQEAGFSIALDDFGTGYSSLSYLKRLPIDILKIDKSFIDDITTPSTKQLIQSVVSIGEFLNLEIIAEGTETLDQIEELTQIGCHCFQGYYYSKPMPADEFIEWHFSEQ